MLTALYIPGPAKTPILRPVISIFALAAVTATVLLTGTWLAVLVVFGLLATVAAHEGAHAWRGHRHGLKLEQYMIGFGPRLYSRTTRSGVEVGARIWPLGAFVKFVDDADEDLPGWPRLDMILAGPLANILIGVLLMFAVQLGIGVTPVDAAKAAGTVSAEMAKSMVDTIVHLPVIAADMARGAISGTPPPDESRTMSPVEVGRLAHEATTSYSPWVNSALLIGAISFALGVANLLPIPPLDGGLATVTILESGLSKIKRRRVRIPSVAVKAVTYVVFAILAIALLAGVVLDLSHPTPNPF